MKQISQPICFLYYTVNCIKPLNYTLCIYESIQGYCLKHCVKTIGLFSTTLFKVCRPSAGMFSNIDSQLSNQRSSSFFLNCILFYIVPKYVLRIKNCPFYG